MKMKVIIPGSKAFLWLLRIFKAGDFHFYISVIYKCYVSVMISQECYFTGPYWASGWKSIPNGIIFEGYPSGKRKVSCGLIWVEQSSQGYHRGPDGPVLISCGAEYNAHAAHTIPPSWSSKSTIQKSHKIESSLQLLDGVGKADRSIMWVIYSALKEVSKCTNTNTNTNTRENAMYLAGRRAQWCW